MNKNAESITENKIMTWAKKKKIQELSPGKKELLQWKVDTVDSYVIQSTWPWHDNKQRATGQKIPETLI